mgnify:CR=1 FL=1
MFCTSCIQGVVANAVANDLEIILCPNCQTQFFSPNDLIPPHRIVGQVLSSFRMNCPHDGCQEQIAYDQYDTHLIQCQFKNVICDHCNQEYLRSDKDEHEANCIDFIKFKNLELSTNLEEAKGEVANVRAELESINSQFKNVTILRAVRYKYFQNDVFVTQLKQATTTSFDEKGRNSQKNFDYFKSYSAKEQLKGAKIFVQHNHRVYSDKKEDGIFLRIKRAETTKTIEAMWNLKVFQNGKQLLDGDYKYTFEEDTGWGTIVEKNCDQSEFCVIVVIKEWKVTNK